MNDRRHPTQRAQDAELAALSQAQRPVSEDEAPICEACLKPIERGQFVHCYEDVGEVHVNCDTPNAFSDDPMTAILVGDPLRRAAIAALQSTAVVSKTGLGRSPDGSGSRPADEAEVCPSSSPKASIPSALVERIERRRTWLREWHKLDSRQFVDRDGPWGAFDFCNDVERLLSSLSKGPEA